MHAIHKEFVGKTSESKVLENGNSSGSVLVIGVSDGDNEGSSRGYNTYLVQYSAPPAALHHRLAENMTCLYRSDPTTLLLTFLIKFLVSYEGFGVEFACYHTPKAVTRKSLTKREERGGA